MSLYALFNDRMIRATPDSKAQKLTAICPCCETRMVAHCGKVLVWHWAHENKKDCDPWHEGESEWHVGWKTRVPSNWVEVVIGSHRADIQRPDGLVIELQHSYISAEDIAIREEFYGRMVWLFDATDLYQRQRMRFRWCRDGVKFSLSHPKKSWFHVTKPMYLDLGGPILLVHDFDQSRCWYSCRMMSRTTFEQIMGFHGDWSATKGECLREAFSLLRL